MRFRRHPQSRNARWRDERGSLTTYFVSAVPAMILLIGLVVDGGGQIRAMQRANDISAETARAAAQSIGPGCAVQGSRFDVLPGPARIAAEEYIEQHPGEATLRSVSFPDVNTVDVRASVTYEPVFLGIIGLGPREIDGEGSAYQYRTDQLGDTYDPSVQTSRCRGF